VPLVQTIQLIGLAGVASYGVARVVHRMGALDYQRARIVEVPIAGIPAMPRGFRVIEIGQDALAAHPIDISPEEQARRFAGGAICLAAFNPRNEFIGVTWVAMSHFEDDSLALAFHLPPDAGWDTGLWIAPEHRLGRGFAALFAGMADWLRARGATRSFSKILDYNVPSLRAHERLGAVPHGNMIMARIGKLQITTRTKPRMVFVGRGRAILDLSL
jgi:hypothetical protein